MNTKHLEFFKNSYYKWLNERLSGLAHMYLFTFLSLLCRLLELYPFRIYCDLYNILVHRVINSDFRLFMKSLFVKRSSSEGYSCVCIKSMLNFLKMRNILHRIQW